MIVLLDPALFVPSCDKETHEEDECLKRIVDDVINICRHTRGRIPETDFYWGKLQRDMVRPLRGRGNHGLTAALSMLKRFIAPFNIGSLPQAGVRMWGVHPLFDWRPLIPDWLAIMEKLVVACAVRGEETLLVSRLWVGRNCDSHKAGMGELIEKNRWRLYVQVPGRPLAIIRCVQTVRNIDVEWTSRVDERLAGAVDGAVCPYCPPAQWWRRKTQVVGTVASKVAFLDAYGNGWTPPTTGGHYHWDVHLTNSAMQATVGLNQVNIVQWGVPKSEGVPGSVHHVPQKKSSHVGMIAWKC